MRVMNVGKALALVAAVAIMAGCSSTSTRTGAGDASGAAGTGTGADGASAYGAGTGTGVSGVGLEEVATLRTVFYFDFDRSVVQQEGFSDLEAHARFLSRNPSVSVRLEGHADERGSREYNMALGERRANAVERLLVVNGAAANQIEAISYGEERPAVVGSHEGAWAQNRRVELKYVTR